MPLTLVQVTSVLIFSALKQRPPLNTYTFESPRDCHQQDYMGRQEPLEKADFQDTCTPAMRSGGGAFFTIEPGHVRYSPALSMSSACSTCSAPE